MSKQPPLPGMEKSWQEWTRARVDDLVGDGTDPNAPLLARELARQVPIGYVQGMVYPALADVIRRHLRDITTGSVARSDGGGRDHLKAEQMEFGDIMDALRADILLSEHNRAAAMRRAEEWCAVHPDSGWTAEEMVRQAIEAVALEAGGE